MRCGAQLIKVHDVNHVNRSIPMILLFSIKLSLTFLHDSNLHDLANLK